MNQTSKFNDSWLFDEKDDSNYDLHNDSYDDSYEQTFDDILSKYTLLGLERYAKLHPKLTKIVKMIWITHQLP